MCPFGGVRRRTHCPPRPRQRIIYAKCILTEVFLPALRRLSPTPACTIPPGAARRVPRRLVRRTFGFRRMKRLQKLPWWLGGIYLCLSLYSYFGSMGGEGHSWWPIFLYPIIWPWGLVEHELTSYLCNQFIPDPKAASATTWIIVDALGGAFYIIIGTLWIWFVGKVISLGATRLFPIKGNKPNIERVSTSP